MQDASLVRKKSDPEESDTKFNSLQQEKQETPNNALAGVVPTRVEIFRPVTR